MRKRLIGLSRSQWLLMLAGVIIGGVVTGLVTANEGIFPNLESSAPHMYLGHVVQSHGEWTYTGARKEASLRAEHVAYSKRVQLIGYCIGAPTTTKEKGVHVPDERWVVLGNGQVMPRPAVDTSMPISRLPPMRCPDDAGPTGIALKVSGERSTVRMTARAPRAVTVSFLIFSRRRRSWSQVALISASRGVVNASTGRQDSAVAMAVACWAASEPGHPRGEPLYAVQPLGGSPEPVYEAAVDQAAEGTNRACVAPQPPSPHQRHGTAPPTKPADAHQAPIEAFQSTEPVQIVPSTTPSRTPKHHSKDSSESESEGTTLVPTTTGD